MSIKQIFETTVFDDKSDQKGRFVIVPKTALNLLHKTTTSYPFKKH
jgi:hypothetical protein